MREKGPEKQDRRNTRRAPEVDEKRIVRACKEKESRKKEREDEEREAARARSNNGALMEIAKSLRFPEIVERGGKMSY